MKDHITLWISITVTYEMVSDQVPLYLSDLTSYCLDHRQVDLVLLCFTLLHFTCVVCGFCFFSKLKAKPSTNKKIKTCFMQYSITVDWNWTHLTPRNVYTLTLFLLHWPLFCSLNIPDMLPPQGLYTDNFLCLDCSFDWLHDLLPDFQSFPQMSPQQGQPFLLYFLPRDYYLWLCVLSILFH